MNKTTTLMLVFATVLFTIILPLCFQAVTGGIEKSTEGIEKINATLTSGF
jgi:hypothetical protein